jgi:hypothetical protein
MAQYLLLFTANIQDSIQKEVGIEQRGIDHN